MNSKNININKNGFREYDARWLYPKDINLEGIKSLGIGLGTQITNRTKKNPRVIVGHDYRSYSEEIKKSLTKGLIEAGCKVNESITLMNGIIPEVFPTLPIFSPIDLKLPQ